MDGREGKMCALVRAPSRRLPRGRRGVGAYTESNAGRTRPALGIGAALISALLASALYRDRLADGFPEVWLTHAHHRPARHRAQEGQSGPPVQGILTPHGSGTG